MKYHLMTDKEKLEVKFWIVVLKAIRVFAWQGLKIVHPDHYAELERDTQNLLKELEDKE